MWPKGSGARKLVAGLAIAAAGTAGVVVALTRPSAASPSAARSATVSPAASPLATPQPGTTRSGVGPAAVIAWGSCSNPELLGVHARCGQLRVPLDYSHAGGTTISLAVSEIRHTSPAASYQGVILTNPGGPGGSGLAFDAHLINALRQENLTNGAAAAGDYDWIGFDPRGVGSSQPKLSCQANYFRADRPSYLPDSPALVQTWLNRSKAYATACEKADGALLAHMTTADSARDMDSIRVALGQSQISYYGFSYGTYLGQVYSSLFPAHVRRLILDSNVDPRRVWYGANLDQDVAFNRNIKIWFSWLARYHAVFQLGDTEKEVENLYYRELSRLRTNQGAGVVGPDELTDAAQQAAYYQQTWPDLGRALSDAVNRGDWSGMETWYEQADSPGDDNSFAVYNAVECTDAQWPLSWEKWAGDNTAVNREAPFMTWANAWFNAPCLYWPAKPATPVRIDGSKVASTLLIDETLDAATPYPGSLEVRRLYPKSVLLAEPGGTTHADSLSGDACVDNTIASYLALGQLPPRHAGDGPDTTCAPLPVPVP